MSVTSKKILPKIYVSLCNSDTSIYLNRNFTFPFLHIPNSGTRCILTRLWTCSSYGIKLFIEYATQVKKNKTKLYQIGFRESDTCTHCTQNTADNYLHLLFGITLQSDTFGFKLLTTHTGLPHPLIPQHVCSRRLINTTNKNLHCNYSLHSLNYHKEGHPH